MPDLKHRIEAAMALAAEKSTCLGLTFGQVKVTPGQYLTKGGKSEMQILPLPLFVPQKP